jgi:hypothetical protein
MKLEITGVRVASRSARLLALGCLIASAPVADAQPRTAPGTIDGIVTDSNLVSLGDATASILGSSLQVVTGSNGRFPILAVPAGHYILVVRRLGFAPTSAALQVVEGDTLRLTFALNRSVTALDTVVVATKRYSMKMAEFEDRRKAGFGHFVTQAEIEKRNAIFLADLLRTVLSVAITGEPGRHHAVNIRSGCEFQLVLDGVALPKGTSLDDLPIPKETAGIEIYSGPATIPLQYKNTHGGGFCGVILVWTRDGA